MNRPIASRQMSNRWPGSSLSARQFTFMILAVLGFSNTSWAQSPTQAESCQISENAEKTTLNIQYDQMNIVVYGWRHLSMLENVENGNQAFKLVQLVKQGAPCEMIKPFLTEELKNKEQLSVFANDLHGRLKKTYFKPATILALESTDEELVTAQKDIREFLKPANIPRIAGIFDSLRSRCRDLKTEADRYQLIIMNPVNVFWVDQTSTGKIIRTKGVDDLSLRNETLAKIPLEAREYDPSKEKYSPEAKRAVQLLHNRMHETAKAPNDAEIQNVLKLITDEASRKRTEVALKGYQILIPLAQKRDVKFVENLINLKADSVLSVGWAHLKGMKEEFAKRCKKVVMKTESPSSTQAAAPVKSSAPAAPSRAAATR